MAAAVGDCHTLQGAAVEAIVAIGVEPLARPTGVAVESDPGDSHRLGNDRTQGFGGAYRTADEAVAHGTGRIFGHHLRRGGPGCGGWCRHADGADRANLSAGAATVTKIGETRVFDRPGRAYHRRARTASGEQGAAIQLRTEICHGWSTAGGVGRARRRRRW